MYKRGVFKLLELKIMDLQLLIKNILLLLMKSKKNTAVGDNYHAIKTKSYLINLN